MADYVPFSETSIATRPFGPVEGVNSADRTFFANQAKMQSLADMFLANEMKQAELQRYQGMTPGELSKSQYEGALARGKTGILPSTLEGLVGEAQTKAAGGKLAVGTLDTDIAATNSTNKSKISSNELTNLNNTVSSYHAQMSSNPMMAPYLYTQMRAALPESMRDQFPETFTPKVLDGLGKMKTALAQTIPHLQAMELQNLKEKGDTERTVITAEATKAAAVTRANGTAKTLASAWNKAIASGNPQAVITAGTALLTSGELDEEEKKSIEATMKKAATMWAAKEAPRQVPQLGSIPGSDAAAARLLQQLGGPGAGGTNTGIPGVTRK